MVIIKCIFKAVVGGRWAPGEPPTRPFYSLGKSGTETWTRGSRGSAGMCSLFPELHFPACPRCQSTWRWHDAKWLSQPVSDVKAPKSSPVMWCGAVHPTSPLLSPDGSPASQPASYMDTPMSCSCPPLAPLPAAWLGSDTEPPFMGLGL